MEHNRRRYEVVCANPECGKMFKLEPSVYKKRLRLCKSKLCCSPLCSYTYRKLLKTHSKQ